MEAYVTGVSKGTTATTFSPTNTVTRVQMTTFLQRSLDQGLARTSRRAALNQWWIPQNANAMQSIAGGYHYPVQPTVSTSGRRTRFSVRWNRFTRAQEQSWEPGPSDLFHRRCERRRQGFCGGRNCTWQGLRDRPDRPPGSVAVAASGLGNEPLSMAFDGTNLWTANCSGGSVSIIPILRRRLIR